METIKTIISWLRLQKPIIKVLAILITILASIIVLFTSCSERFYNRFPDISENQIGAEGVVSKEKNVSRQTKWYFKPKTEKIEVELLND